MHPCGLCDTKTKLICIWSDASRAFEPPHSWTMRPSRLMVLQHFFSWFIPLMEKTTNHVLHILIKHKVFFFFWEQKAQVFTPKSNKYKGKLEIVTFLFNLDETRKSILHKIASLWWKEEQLAKINFCILNIYPCKVLNPLNTNYLT